MLELVVLFLSVLVNSVLGLAVYIKNPKKDMNRLFFYLTISLSAWLVFTHFSLHPFAVDQLTWVRFVLAAAAVLCYFVLTSFAVFPDGNFTQLRFATLATYYLLFVIALTQTPFVFKTLNFDSAGHAQPVPAPGIVFFALLAVTYLGGAVFLLLKKFRRATGLIKNQLRTVIFGLATSFAGILVTNFLIVSIFKNTSLISFAPLLTLLLTGSMAYAILKHKLFDLRPAIARAMAYLLTFSLVILVYSGLAFFVGSLFSFKANSVNSSQRLFYVGLAVLTALAFQPLKRFFDKTTNRIFFRDAYEPQILLDGLSDILVGNIKLEEMLIHSAKLIMDDMKLVNCDFVIRDDKNYRGIGTSLSDHGGSELPDGLLAIVKSRKHPTLLTDDLPYTAEERNVLTRLNYAAIIRLSTRTSVVGHMLAGSKRSGDALSPLDVRILSTIADELAIATENALRFEEIRRFNITLQERIEAATKELRKANTRLKDLDQAKDEFISMASHQLRTPLTTVKGYISLILDGDAGKVGKQQEDLLQHAFDGADRMVYLIGDLLNISRIQSGKFVIENKPTKLDQVIATEVEQLQESARNHHLKLTFHKPDNFPMLNIDETKTRQVIMNFLDNAIYYTPSGGSIDVALQATDKEITYTVTDTGLGVPKAEQHHLFTKFYRAGNARKMRPDGTGLGLFMAKKVIVAQGGAIIFNSTEGKGSTFGFSFPRSAVELEMDSIPKAGKPEAKTEDEPESKAGEKVDKPAVALPKS